MSLVNCDKCQMTIMIHKGDHISLKVGGGKKKKKKKKKKTTFQCWCSKESTRNSLYQREQMFFDKRCWTFETSNRSFEKISKENIKWMDIKQIKTRNSFFVQFQPYKIVNHIRSTTISSFAGKRKKNHLMSLKFDLLISINENFLK